MFTFFLASHMIIETVLKFHIRFSKKKNDANTKNCKRKRKWVSKMEASLLPA